MFSRHRPTTDPHDPTSRESGQKVRRRTRQQHQRRRPQKNASFVDWKAYDSHRPFRQISHFAPTDTKKRRVVPPPPKNPFEFILRGSHPNFDRTPTRAKIGYGDYMTPGEISRLSRTSRGMSSQYKQQAADRASQRFRDSYGEDPPPGMSGAVRSAFRGIADTLS